MRKRLLITGLIVLLSICPVVNSGKEETMLDPIFVDGFRSEIANRNFARLVTEKLATTAAEDQGRALWSAYHSLEVFNLSIYHPVATQWGLDTTVGHVTRLKAEVLARFPQALHPWLLSSTLKRTKDYMITLEALQTIGPDSEHWFLQYMVDQEALQIDMMEKAILGDYLGAARLVEDFLEQHNQVN